MTDVLAYRRSEGLANLFAALAATQGAYPIIEKDKTASIASKRTGATFTYDYVDLATILAAVRAPLAANKLAVLQMTTPDPDSGNGVLITTLLGHASGEWIESQIAMPVDEGSDARSVASAITYGRRYGLIALIGVAPSEEDDDGAGAADTTARPGASRPPAGASPQPLPGYRLIDAYQLDDSGWGHVRFHRADAEGGAMTYATKRPQLLAVAEQAYQDRVPVRVEGRPRAGHDGWWLDTIARQPTEHAVPPPDEPSAPRDDEVSDGTF